MAVIRKNPTMWHSTILDKDFDSQQAAEHYDGRMMQHLEGVRAQQEAALEKLTPEELKLVAEGFQYQAARQSGAEQLNADIAAIVAANGDYQDDPALGGNQNGQLALGYLTARGKGKHPTRHDLQEAIDALRESGALILKPVEAQAEREQQLDEETLYSMPLNELAAKARLAVTGEQTHGKTESTLTRSRKKFPRHDGT